MHLLCLLPSESPHTVSLSKQFILLGSTGSPSARPTREPSNRPTDQPTKVSAGAVDCIANLVWCSQTPIKWKAPSRKPTAFPSARPTGEPTDETSKVSVGGECSERDLEDPASHFASMVQSRLPRASRQSLLPQARRFLASPRPFPPLAQRANQPNSRQR